MTRPRFGPAPILLTTPQVSPGASHPLYHAVFHLIIEDQDADFEAVVRGLRQLDPQHPVVGCSDADDALDYLYRRGSHATADCSASSPPEIILLDLSLRGSEGKEILARVKQDDYLKTIATIVWSGSNDPRDAGISYRLGANSFVRKTFDFSEIIQTRERLAHFWLEAAVLSPAPTAAPRA